MAQKKYKFAVIAADVVIFAIERGVLKVLLIKMEKKPFTGIWAAPGGLVQPREPVDAAAKRHIASKTGIKSAYLEQLYTFGKPDRDPFGRVVSVAYMALLPDTAITLKTTAEYTNVRWFGINNLPKLAYDHKEIINYAIGRLGAKLRYTNIAYSLLPKKFTLGELQRAYEVVLDKTFDKRNFRKKFLALKLVKRLREKKLGQASRPAELYSFASHYPQIVEIL